MARVSWRTPVGKYPNGPIQKIELLYDGEIDGCHIPLYTTTDPNERSTVLPVRLV